MKTDLDIKFTPLRHGQPALNVNFQGFRTRNQNLKTTVVQLLQQSIIHSSHGRHYPNNNGTSTLKFEVCKSVHHLTIQRNQITRCNNFSSLLLDDYVQPNVFRASSRPSSGAQRLQQQHLVLLLERGDSSAVGRGRSQQHCYHHASTVKPEAATAVVELLIMGMRTPETC
jgi:hypothetical protein